MPSFDDYPDTPPAAPYANGTVSVGTTATLICAPSGCNQVLISNSAGGTVYLGGSTVTATGATQGYPLAASTTALIPVIAGAQCQLYGITTTGTSNISYLYPQG